MCPGNNHEASFVAFSLTPLLFSRGYVLTSNHTILAFNSPCIRNTIQTFFLAFRNSIPLFKFAWNLTCPCHNMEIFFKRI